MGTWHYEEMGKGRPLILLHGIGMSSRAWQPVMPILAKKRRVIAFDFEGFGKSPKTTNDKSDPIEYITNELLENIKSLGISDPVDIVGNSMGGYIALEAAKRNMARKVFCISPGGLWQKRLNPMIELHFQGMRIATNSFPGITRGLLQIGVFRELIFALPIALGGKDIPSDVAWEMAQEFANSPGFDEVLANAKPFRDGHHISAPITIAFGTRDWVLTAAARNRDQLPDHAVWIFPENWGHVPMWQDPVGVSKIILSATE